MVGDLSIRGIAREVTLDTRYVAPQDGNRNRRMKLTLTTALNRPDFGMRWNTVYLGAADNLTVKLMIEARAEPSTSFATDQLTRASFGHGSF